MDLQKIVEKNREGFAKNPYRLMPENRPEGCPRVRDIIRTKLSLLDAVKPPDAPKSSDVLWEVQMVYVREDGHINLRCIEYEPKFKAWARILDYTAPETSIEIVKTWEHRVAEKLMGDPR
jgi:hypothetical protein